MKNALSRSIYSTTQRFDRQRAAKHFSYFFDDVNLGQELKDAQELGVLRLLYPSLANFIESNDVEGLDLLFPYKNPKGKPLSPEIRFKRMFPIFNHLSAEDRIAFKKELSHFYPDVDRFLFSPTKAKKDLLRLKKKQKKRRKTKHKRRPISFISFELSFQRA